MTFKQVEWGEVILAALATAVEKPDEDVVIHVPDQVTATVVSAAIRALRETGDEAAWRLGIEIKSKH